MSVFAGGSAGGRGTSGLSDDVPVALILDASRSMLGEVEGRRRMDVARDAMLQIAPGPLTQRRASLVTFGNDRVNECDNIPIIHGFGSDDVRGTLDAIQALEPAEPGEGESLFGSRFIVRWKWRWTPCRPRPRRRQSSWSPTVSTPVTAISASLCRRCRTAALPWTSSPSTWTRPAGAARLRAGRNRGGALLPSDNLTSITSYVSLLSRAAQGESRSTCNPIAAMQEDDALERLRQSLDADLLRVFGELDEARIRVRSLEAVLANTEEQQGEQVSGLEAQIADAAGYDCRPAGPHPRARCRCYPL